MIPIILLLSVAAACSPVGEVASEAPSASHPDARILYSADFDTVALGVLSDSTFSALFRDPPGSFGVAAGRVAVVETGGSAGRALRVRYPPDRWGAGGGAIWRIELQDTVAEAWLSYRLRFDPTFDFVKGGKLPGLGGGAANTGGEKPDGTDGWSARMMWRGGGRAVFYVYHPDQPHRFGEDLRWGSVLRPVRFTPGVWHHVVHHVKMNDPGEWNGRLRGWMDGQLVAEHDRLRFRDSGNFAIDKLLFSTFFGGSGEQWAPDREQAAEFDELIVWTEYPPSASHPQRSP